MYPTPRTIYTSFCREYSVPCETEQTILYEKKKIKRENNIFLCDSSSRKLDFFIGQIQVHSSKEKCSHFVYLFLSPL